jgi:hypothetical protein
VFHGWLLAQPRNPHDIESRFAVMQSFLIQEELRCLNHPFLFPALDSFQRIAKLVVGATLYFDKDNDLAIEHDEIDLPSPAVVALDELVTFLLQVALRKSLSIPAEYLSDLRHIYLIENKKPLSGPACSPDASSTG